MDTYTQYTRLYIDANTDIQTKIICLRYLVSFLWSSAWFFALELLSVAENGTDGRTYCLVDQSERIVFSHSSEASFDGSRAPANAPSMAID